MPTYSCHFERDCALVELCMARLAMHLRVLLPARAGARRCHPQVERPAFSRQRAHPGRGVEQPVQGAKALLPGNGDLPHPIVRVARGVGDAVLCEPAAKAIPDKRGRANQPDPQVCDLLPRSPGGEVHAPVAVDQAPYERGLIFGRKRRESGGKALRPRQPKRAQPVCDGPRSEEHIPGLRIFPFLHAVFLADERHDGLDEIAVLRYNFNAVPLEAPVAPDHAEQPRKIIAPCMEKCLVKGVIRRPGESLLLAPARERALAHRGALWDAAGCALAAP